PLRRELARGQYPLVTVLGCSDSRVSPSLVFDQTVGDLFEVRAAGNVADAVALGSIEYAVQDLRTPMLLVLGHDQCGAVVAAVSGEAMPSQGLQALVKRIAPAVERVRGQATGEALVALAVEANVQQSARDLLSESAILGPSGCGKSTILNMLGGLVAPSAGRVEIDDVGVTGAVPVKVGYVFQKDTVLPWRTVARNIAVGLEYRGVPRPERERRVRDA